MRNPGKEPRVSLRPTRAKWIGAGRKIMNESTIRKSAVDSTVKGPKMRIPMGVRWVAWFVALMFANFPAVSLARSPCPGIHVKVLNIKNSKGNVACALFESPVGFPRKYLHYATNIMVIKIREAEARFDFIDIPPGTYALVVVHDENMNGKLDTNWLGAPKEGYGFSNDIKAFLSAPSFSAATFHYDGRNIDLTITLNY
jgi:uncharacterized protein (DUF2141 family)